VIDFNHLLLYFSSNTMITSIKNYWPFNESSVDVIGNAHLTVGANVAFVPDRNGNLNSATFLNSGYYTAPPGVYFSGDYTITAWINIQQTATWSRILDCGVGSGGNNRMHDLFFTFVDGQSPRPSLGYLSSSIATNFATTVTLNLDQWYHVAVTLSGSLAKIYINGGTPTSSSPFQIPTSVTRTECFIGRSNNHPQDEDAIAYLDEIKIFNQALSQDQIIVDMNS
jgi:hypothetical protein